MSNQKLPVHEEVVVQIKARWTELTDEDLHHGLKHRDTFLQRLCHRHHLGMDEAEDQLRAFEEKYPGMGFERS